MVVFESCTNVVISTFKQRCDFSLENDIY